MVQMHSLSVEKLHEYVHTALTLWHKGNVDGSPFQELLLYHQALVREKSVRGATNLVLTDAIAQLREHSPEEAEILHLRFAQECSAHIVANKLSISEGNVFKRQREAIEHLSTILLQAEQVERSERQSHYVQHMEPPSYTSLFGIDTALDELTATLIDPNPPWTISIEGIGGIGKTSVAQALTSRFVESGIVGWRHFEGMAWITARHHFSNAGGSLRSLDRPSLPIEELVTALAEQILPKDEYSDLGLKALEAKVTQQLKRSPHLVIIDNLETESDFHALLESLKRWTNPSKFLITSRRSLYDQLGIYHYRLPGLNLADSMALVRHEARLRNLPVLAEAPDEQIQAIYQTVGGNPLALRLVIGQTFIHSLDDVLVDLRRAQGEAVEQLYTHIYRRAWRHLDEAGRQTLLIMPLISEAGSDLEFLSAIAQQQPAQLRPPLERLISLNLVDSRGTLHHRLYTIHSLTRSFLHEQVLRWSVVGG
jgi:hypothetical protein